MALLIAGEVFNILMLSFTYMYGDMKMPLTQYDMYGVLSTLDTYKKDHVT